MFLCVHNNQRLFVPNERPATDEEYRRQEDGNDCDPKVCHPSTRGRL